MIAAALSIVLTSFQLAPMPKAPIAPILMTDSSGVARRIPAGGKATVLFFVATDCPIANRMAPELGRIVRAYQKKSVSFEYVYVDPTQTEAQIRRHLAEYKLGAPGILDKSHKIVEAVGATVTPQAVVLAKNGRMLYRGRINDLFLEHGRSRNAPKTEDLKIALNQFLANKPIKVTQTPALGCNIPPID
jgi:thiol-disulfide isomerase/thioredoxin